MSEWRDISTAQKDGTRSAIDDIAAERARQISAEGWTPAHDDEHSDGEMARAASCYAMIGSATWLCDMAIREKFETGKAPLDWPWSSEWWRPKGPRRNLVRAAALIVAEIERLDRIAEKEKT